MDRCNDAQTSQTLWTQTGLFSRWRPASARSFGPGVLAARTSALPAGKHLMNSGSLPGCSSIGSACILSDPACSVVRCPVPIWCCSPPSRVIHPPRYQKTRIIGDGDWRLGRSCIPVSSAPVSSSWRAMERSSRTARPADSPSRPGYSW